MKITVQFDDQAEFEKFFFPDKKPTAPKEEPTAPKEEPTAPKSTYTLEQVRAIVTGKSTDGFKDQIKTHLQEKYQTSKLPALDPAKYDEFVAYLNGLK